MNFIDISIIIAALFGFYFGSLKGMDNKVTKRAFASLVFLASLYFLPSSENAGLGILPTGLALLLSLTAVVGLRYYKAAREVRQGLSVCMINNNLGGVTIALFFAAFSLFLWDRAIVNDIVGRGVQDHSIFIALLDANDDPINFSGVKLIASERP